MKIIVTGGAGFIGSHLVDRLIDDKHEVVVLDDLSGGYERNINKKAKFYNLDLRNKSKTSKIVKDLKPEIVYHLAANAAENKAQFSPIDITTRNYDTFLNTLVPAVNSGMKRMIVTSSIAVYGALQTPFKETDKPEPEDLYGISKLSMEESLKILSKVHGFEYVITRPHNVYGPRQNMSDPYRNVVTLFMNAILSGKPYYIYGDGEQRRCFSYVDDVVDALFKCGFEDVNGKIFNVGSDKDYSINELSESIQKVTNTSLKPVYISDRPQEVKVAISDHTLARNYLNYRDSTTFIDGIRNTWKYAESLGPQKLKFDKVEMFSPSMPENWKTKKQQTPKVTMVISNHNGVELGILSDTFKNLKNINYKNIETIFVDNNSTDNSIDFINKSMKKLKNARLIENDNNYTKGLNKAINQSDGEYIAIFHNDVELGDDFIKIITGNMQKDKEVAIAQGKVLLHYDHNIVDSVGETIDGFGTPLSLGSGKQERLYKNKSEILSPASSAFIVKRSALMAVGGFDEVYHIGHEVMDLALRLRRAGYLAYCYPEAVTYHKHGSTNLNKNYRDNALWHAYKNRARTIIKNFPLQKALVSTAILFSVYFSTGLYEIIATNEKRRGISRLSAIFWSIGNLPFSLAERFSLKNKLHNSELDPEAREMMPAGEILKSINSYMVSK